jgi:periplasmic protein TonB
MATLLESGAKPYGSTKGMAISMLLHAALITAAVAGTAKVVLPPREKVEEHPILYVAPPPPKPVQMAEPLPKTEAPKPKTKTPAPAKVYRAPPPKAKAPTPQPVVSREPAAPSIPAPTRVPTALPSVDLKIATTIGDVVKVPATADVIGKPGGISREGSVKSDGEDGGGKGLGSGSSRAYDENQVERAVEVTRKAEPRYPESLKSVGVEGVVMMHFIVGADGRVEPGSIQVLSTPHKLFADAVRTALLNTRYRPAEAGGRSVRQLVEQSFTFRIDK